MTKVIDRTGSGAAITAAENDANLSSLSGINEAQTGTTYTVTIDDQNRTIEHSNASAVTVTLTLLSTITGALHTDDFRVIYKNIGAGVVTINTNVADTFDDTTTSITLNQYDSVELQSSSTATIWNVIRFYDADVPTLTGTETFTNKTLATPIITGLVQHSVEGGIVASSTQTQAAATQLTSEFNLIGTVATSGDAVKLPSAVAGYFIVIGNSGANACRIYPSSGDDAGNGVDAFVTLTATDWFIAYARSSTNWIQIVKDSIFASV